MTSRIEWWRNFINLPVWLVVGSGYVPTFDCISWSEL